MAENLIRVEGMSPPGTTLPVTGTATPPPSGTQNVAVTSPLSGTSVATASGTATATTSLTAATTGTGTSVDFGASKSNITMAILVTGTVTAGVMGMDNPRDGTKWGSDGTVDLAPHTH